MDGRRRRALGAAGLLLVLVGAAACSTDDEPEVSPGPDAFTGVPAPTATPTPTREPLADLAESAASELATQAAPPITAATGAGPVEGADIGWPQCYGSGLPLSTATHNPLPLPSARYVVLGLTNGPGFTTNPCLTAQVDWVRAGGLAASAYSVISYPTRRELGSYGAEGPYDGGTRLGRLANVGYRQAELNVTTMRAAGLESPIVWIDIEEVGGRPWSFDITDNAAVVTGMVQGYRDRGYGIGVYSTPALYAGIVGALELDAVEWRAAGPGTRRTAVVRCSEAWSVQGGEVAMTQWVEGKRDRNITCPGMADRLGEWFHQY